MFLKIIAASLFCAFTSLADGVSGSFVSRVELAQNSTPTPTPTAAERLFGVNPDKSSGEKITTNSSASKIVTVGVEASKDPLPAEQAFKIGVIRKPNGLSVRLEAAQGYYLYRDTIKIVETTSQKNLQIKLPKGKIKFDETFGKDVATLRGVIDLPVIAVKSKFTERLSVDVYSQGCADIGICYPPQYQRYEFQANQPDASVQSFEPNQQPPSSVNAVKPAASQAKTITNTTATTVDSSGQAVNNANMAQNRELNSRSPINTINSNQTNQTKNKPVYSQQQGTKIAQLFENANIAWLSLVFVGLGLLLTFTPCVLPMMPIVSAIVLGKSVASSTSNETVTTKQAIKRTICYILGMATTYTLVGVAAGLAGQGIAGYLQQPWVLCLFAALLIALAGAQFGWYTVSLPSVIATRLAAQQKNLENKSGDGLARYAGIGLMGALSALMVGPCLTAPLAGTLTYIAQTGNAGLGGLALFSLAIGMGIPLFVLALGAAQWLPKTGAWMAQVNYGFGIMLLGVALWTVQSLLADWLFAGFFSILLLLAGQALGGLQLFNSQMQTPQTSRGLQLRNLLGGVLLIWAITMIVGMAAGQYDPVTPLKSKLGGVLSGVHYEDKESSVNSSSSNSNSPTLLTRQPQSIQAVRFEKISSQELGTHLVQASEKPILVEFYADWCVSCIELERFTFTDKSVAEQLSKFKLIRVDVTKNTLQDRALLKQYGIFGPPAILFFEQKAGQTHAETPNSRIIGFQAAPEFLQNLQTIFSKKL